jgi:hypothetical protein
MWNYLEEEEEKARVLGSDQQVQALVHGRCVDGLEKKI